MRKVCLTGEVRLGVRRDVFGSPVAEIIAKTTLTGPSCIMAHAWIYRHGPFESPP